MQPAQGPCVPKPCVCSASDAALQQFAASVRNTASMSVLYGGSVAGYFRHRFSGCVLQSPAGASSASDVVRAKTAVMGPPTLCTGSSYENQPGVYENGYCLDSNVQIFPGSEYPSCWCWGGMHPEHATSVCWLVAPQCLAHT